MLCTVLSARNTMWGQRRYTVYPQQAYNIFRVNNYQSIAQWLENCSHREVESAPEAHRKGTFPGLEDKQKSSALRTK